MSKSAETSPVRADAEQHELIEFRLLIAIAVSCFFVSVAVSRLTGLGRSGDRPQGVGGESCFREAKRMAYTAIPFAFMK